MAQAATHARSAAAASLKDSVRVLTKYYGTQNPSKRLLKSKLEKVLADKHELVTRHYIYAEKAGKDLEDEEEVNWLTPKLDAADDICDEVTLRIEALEDAADEVQRDAERILSENKEKAEIKLAELQCASEEKLFKGENSGN